MIQQSFPSTVFPPVMPRRRRAAATCGSIRDFRPAEASAAEEQNNVRQPGGAVLVVQRHAKGAAAAAKVHQAIEEPTGGFRVQPGEGLVEEQNRRLVDYRPGDGPPLPHSPRKRRRQPIGVRRQADGCEHLVGARRGPATSCIRAAKTRFSRSVKCG